MKKNFQWSVTLAVKYKDFKDAAEFLESKFSLSKDNKTWSEDYFKWKLTGINPAGAGFMLLAKIQEKIIGTVTLTRKKALINGKVVNIAEIGDTYTDPEYRRGGECVNLLDNNYLNQSIFGRLVHEMTLLSKLNGIEVIYGTPNENSYPGYISKLGFKEANIINNKKLKKIIIPTINGIFKKNGLKINFYYKNNNVVFPYTYKKNNIEYIVKMNLPEEEEFNKYIKIQNYGSAIELLKNYQYWVHRYKMHPLAKYEIRSIFSKNKLYGIYSYRIYENENGINICCIMDWTLLDNSLKITDIVKQIKCKENCRVDAYTYLCVDSNYFEGIFNKKSNMKLIALNNSDNIKIEFNSFSIGSSDAA